MLPSSLLFPLVLRCSTILPNSTTAVPLSFRVFYLRVALSTTTEQIMLSEAEPALLTELCATLMRENNNSEGDVRRNTNSTATTHGAATPKARSWQQQPRTIRVTTSTSFAQRRRQTTAGVGKTGASVSTGRGGPLGSRRVNANNGCASSSSDGLGTGGRGGNGETLRPNNKGRRLDGTPTKSTGGGGGDVAHKSTRKASPKKGTRAPREMSLSEDQQRVVDLVVEGKSVFFTGEREISGSLARRGHGGERKRRVAPEANEV